MVPVGHRSLRGDGSFSNTSAGPATEPSITPEQNITLWKDWSMLLHAIVAVAFTRKGQTGRVVGQRHPSITLRPTQQPLMQGFPLGLADTERHLKTVSFQGKR